MKTNNILLALAALIITSLSFVSCSKDDDNGKGKNKSKSIVGAWEVDDEYDGKRYYIIDKDGNGRYLDLYNFENEIPSYEIDLFDWKVEKGGVVLSSGVCSEFFDYFTSSNGKKMSLTDQDKDQKVLTRLTDSEKKAMLDRLPFDEDLVGFWKLESGSLFIEIDQDGYAQQLALNSPNPYVTTTTWEAWKEEVVFKTFQDQSAKYPYTITDNKNSLTLGSLGKFIRITEQEYKAQFNTYYKSNSIIGAWEDANPWASDPTSPALHPTYNDNFLVFYEDGTFTSVRLKSKNKNSTGAEVFKFNGKYQFYKSQFTFTINNDEREGVVPYQIRSNTLWCGLSFLAPSDIIDKYWGTGKFYRVNMSKVEPYL